jgi:hypothetical protein
VLLYNRDELFAQVEQLTGLGFREDRHISSRRQRATPVIAVSGSRGIGKTAVLKEISSAYGNRAPRVMLDIGDSRYSAGWPGSGPESAPLVRVLRDLKWGLELQVKLNNRALRFPRLALALLAITVSRPDAEITLDEARRQLADAKESVAKIAHDEREGWANDWTSDVISDILSDLSGHIAPFPVSILVRASVRAFLSKTLNARHRAAPLDWHRDYDPGEPGDGYEALITLGRNFRQGGDWLPEAEQALVAAFLADLSAGYQGLARLTRAAFPLVLLDNAHLNSVGERFLQLALAIRATGDADHLVIIATGSEALAARLAGAAGSRAGLEAVTLTGLTQSDVLRMLAKSDPRRLPPDIASIVFRLTGGLPLGIEVLTSALAAVAAASARRGGTAVLARSQILDIEVPGTSADPGALVAERILGQLLPDPGWRSRLTVLSAAQSGAEAQAAAEVFLDADDGELVADAEELLARNGWNGDAGPLVGDRFLRVLLLHQLGRRAAGTTGTAVHEALRDRYDAVLAGPLDKLEPFRLHHCLALGEAAAVVQRLRDSFAESSADAWIDAVRVIARAPYGADQDPEQGSGRHQDRRRDVAAGEADLGSRDEVLRSVNRLLHAAWLLADPLGATDPEMEGKLADELKFLSHKHPTGNGVLSRAARAPQAWVHGYQPPALPPSPGE